MLVNKATNPAMDLNIYCLWAYDTVTALAIAVEAAKTSLGISSFGQRLVSELSKTKFRGLAGDFALVEGKLRACGYETFNIIVTQGPHMNEIEQKNLGPRYSSQDPLSSIIFQGTSSLTLQEFAGLFLVTGSVVLVALFCSKTSIGRKLTRAMQYFIQRCHCLVRTPPPHSTDSAEDTAGGGSNHEFTHNNASPPPGEDDDSQLTREEAAQVSKTTPENESSPYAGEGNENELPTNQG